MVRPVLDAAQTMPPFVYLVPAVALFGASRFTAVAAAVIYAAPVAIKIVADGIVAVPATAVEAATSAGSTAWQTIAKVQLPMARQSLTLAVNQGLCYVLSMVVVDPRWQGFGIADRLIHALMDGRPHIRFSLAAADGVDAYYRRFGFEPDTHAMVRRRQD